MGMGQVVAAKMIYDKYHGGKKTGGNGNSGGYYIDRHRHEPKSSSKNEYGEYLKPYSHDEYMYYIVKNDEELNKFFNNILDQKAKLKRIKIEELGEEAVKAAEEVSQRKQEAIEEGITFTDNHTIEILNGKRYSRFGNDEPITKHFSVGINGAKISLEMLKKDGNPYEEKYLKWKEEYKDIDEQLENIRKELKKQRRMIQLTITSNRFWKKHNLIEKLEKEEKKLMLESENGKELKLSMEVFANLTDVQKQKIIGYFNSIEKFNTITTETHSLSYSDDSIEELKKFVLELIKSGKISKEELENIENLLLDKSKKYDPKIGIERPDSTCTHSFENTKYELISWFTYRAKNKMQDRIVGERDDDDGER